MDLDDRRIDGVVVFTEPPVKSRICPLRLRAADISGKTKLAPESDPWRLTAIDEDHSAEAGAAESGSEIRCVARTRWLS